MAEFEMTDIPLFKVNMPSGVDQVLKPILESGYISEGPVTKEFEQKFQFWIENPFTAVVQSGTAALTIAMRLAGVETGTEVITSPFTCLAMNEPILSLGAHPIWCDVEPSTGNIDPSKIEALITDKTRAILFVNWAGTPAELDEINAIAKKHGIKTIQDCAHALGARYKGQNVSLLADYTCYSFQAIKHMTTIDGGAVSCMNKEDYDRAVLLRWFGCKRGHNKSPIKWEGDVTEYGYKMHLSDVNSAIGLESLKTIDSVLAAHQRNGQYLLQELRGLDGLELLKIPSYISSSHWIFTLKLRDSEHRAKFSHELDLWGVRNNIVHTRNDSYSLFKDYKRDLPGVDEFGSRQLSIPCGWWCGKKELDYIIDCVRKSL